VLYGTNVVLYGTNVVLYGTNVVLYGTNVVLYGTNVVLYDTNVVLCGTNVVLYGTNVVLYGTNVVLCGTNCRPGPGGRPLVEQNEEGLFVMNITEMVDPTYGRRQGSSQGHLGQILVYLAVRPIIQRYTIHSVVLFTVLYYT